MKALSLCAIVLILFCAAPPQSETGGCETTNGIAINITSYNLQVCTQSPCEMKMINIFSDQEPPFEVIHSVFVDNAHNFEILDSGNYSIFVAARADSQGTFFRDITIPTDESLTSHFSDLGTIRGEVNAGFDVDSMTCKIWLIDSPFYIIKTTTDNSVPFTINSVPAGDHYLQVKYIVHDNNQATLNGEKTMTKSLRIEGSDTASTYFVIP